MSVVARSGPRRPTAWGAVAAIATNSFREAIRDRVLYLLFALALVALVGSRVLSLLTVGDEEKIVADVGLSAISLFGVLTAMFVGVSVVFKEIERRTVLTLLANPISRTEFVIGKYLGLCAVLGIIVAVLAATLSAVLWLRGSDPVRLLPAIALMAGELAVVSAFAVLFSCYTNPMLAAAGTVSVFVAGRLAWSLDLLASRLPPGAGRWVCGAVRAVMPNLDRLDLKLEAVHGLPLPAGQPWWGLLYAAGYSAAVVGAACVVFARREFN